MNYIKRSSLGIIIDGLSVNTTLSKYLNKMCLRTFSTLQGRIEASRVILKRKSSVPFYVDETIILFATERIRNYNSVYINSCNVLRIKRVCKKVSKVTFMDFSVLYVYCSMNKLALQLQLSKELLRK